MIDDASGKVSDANAGEKSRMADREGHGAVDSSLDRTSESAQAPRPEDEHAYSYRVVTVGEAVERAVSGEWDVPEFQRQFVWRPSQVCDVADSLWRAYPIGALLLWRSANSGGDWNASIRPVCRPVRMSVDASDTGRKPLILYN